MEHLYVAGPMRGIPEFNFPAFNSTTNALRVFGYAVFNPAERDIENGFDPKDMTGLEDLSNEGFDLREALRADLQFVTQEANGICVLPGWDRSSGARAEVATAWALDIPVGPLEYWWSAVGYRDGSLLIHKPDFSKAMVTPMDPMIPDMIPKVYPPVSGEVRTTSSTGGQKGVKPERFDLIPVHPLDELARHYASGANKYDDHQWRKGYEWSKSYASLLRHATQWWNGEDIDEETGSNHMAAVAWHAFTLLQFIQDYPQFDDRYKGHK